MLKFCCAKHQQNQKYPCVFDITYSPQKLQDCSFRAYQLHFGPFANQMESMCPYLSISSPLDIFSLECSRSGGTKDDAARRMSSPRPTPPLCRTRGKQTQIWWYPKDDFPLFTTEHMRVNEDPARQTNKLENPRGARKRVLKQFLVIFLWYFD